MTNRVVTFVLLVVFVQEKDGQVINIPTTASAVDGISQYILYTHAQSWNTARLVCQSIGATLARIDTLALLQNIQDEAAGAWATDWDHMWTGLHRAPDDSLVFDDSACSSFNLTLSGMDVFKDAHDYDNDATKQCLRVQKDAFKLEKHSCSTRLIFLCEKKSGTCPYNSVPTSPEVVAQTNATATSCQSVCNQLSGCYLSGNYLNSHCVMLKAPAGTDVMYEKMCYSAGINSDNTDSFRGSDDTNTVPTTCTPVTDSPVVTSTVINEAATTAATAICPSSSYIYTTTSSVDCTTEVIVASPSLVNVTVTETSTETITETSTETLNVTIFQTATLTLTQAISASVNYITETSTETVTATATEVFSTCEQTQTSTDSFCVTNTQILTTEMTSTFILTTVLDCTGNNLDFLTITPSCPDQSVQIQETTVTFYQETPCTCESPYSTLEPTAVISSDYSSLSQSGTETLGPSTEDSFQSTVCRYYNNTVIDSSSLDAIVQSIVSELTVETKNLSKTIRKKTSAPDPRVSSTSIGFTAISLTIVPLAFVILLDIPGIFQQFRSSFLSVKYRGTP